MPARGTMLAVLALSLSLPARADPAPAAVERAAGAEGCPDEQELAERVAEIQGRAPSAELSSFGVRFTRDDAGFSAEIRGAGGASVRTLRARGTDCAALAHATALTLALLLDAGVVVVEPEPAQTPAPVAPARPAEAPRAVAPAAPRRTREHATFALGGAGTFGVLRAVTPALVADAGVEVSRFRAGVGALWLPETAIALGQGELHQSLLAGLARTCLALVRDGAFRWDACGGVLVGRVDARASGYSRNGRAHESWLAVPVELAAARIAPGLGWDVALGALVPLRTHAFSVDGLGVAYEAPPLAAMLSLRAIGVLAL